MLKSYVSIDIETTGLNPATCQILEIGMVVDDWVTPIEELPHFHCLIDNGLIFGEPYALQMNAAILKKIADPAFYKSQPDEVATLMGTFFAANKIPLNRVPAAGKNFASFDRQFLERLPRMKNFFKFNHRSYDPGMLFLDFENDEGIPDSKTCMERAGLTGEVAHTALEDAIAVVKMIRYARQSRCSGQISPETRKKILTAVNSTERSERPEPRNGY